MEHEGVQMQCEISYLESFTIENHWKYQGMDYKGGVYIYVWAPRYGGRVSGGPYPLFVNVSTAKRITSSKSL